MNAVTGGALRARGKQALGALVNVTAYYVIGELVLAYSIEYILSD